MTKEFYTVKDSDGNYLPRAIITSADEYGKTDIEAFLKRNDDCILVKVKLVEVK